MNEYEIHFSIPKIGYMKTCLKAQSETLARAMLTAQYAPAKIQITSVRKVG